MKVGILGSGHVGQALARGFLNEGGYEVLLATREPDSDKGAQLKSEFPNVTVCGFATAAREAELAVICVPWPAVRDALTLADAEHNLQGKTLIDANNPLDRGENGVRVLEDLEGSAGQMVQTWVPGARVVKCWNNTGAANFYKPQLAMTPTMFLCGDNIDAKGQVSEIVKAFGWEPLDAGGIEHARELESLAVVWINYAMKAEGQHAFRML